MSADAIARLGALAVDADGTLGKLWGEWFYRAHPYTDELMHRVFTHAGECYIGLGSVLVAEGMGAAVTHDEQVALEQLSQAATLAGVWAQGRAWEFATPRGSLEPEGPLDGLTWHDARIKVRQDWTTAAPRTPVVLGLADVPPPHLHPCDPAGCPA